MEQLTLTSALNLGSVVAAGALIYSVISLMGTLKIALRAMFGLVNPVMRPMIGQLANIAGFLVIVAGVLVTAVASVVTTTLSGNVGRALGLPDSLTGTGAWLTTLLISFLIDTGVLALLITICGVRPPRRDLTLGCMLAPSHSACCAKWGPVRSARCPAILSWPPSPPSLSSSCGCI